MRSCKTPSLPIEKGTSLRLFWELCTFPTRNCRHWCIPASLWNRNSNTLRNIGTHCPYSSQFLGPWDSLGYFQLIEFYYSFPLGWQSTYSLGLACMADPANEQDLGLRVWILTNYVIGRLSMIWARPKESSFFFFFWNKHTHTIQERRDVILIQRHTAHSTLKL